MDTDIRELERLYQYDKNEELGKKLLAKTLRTMDLSLVVERILTSFLGRSPTVEETLKILKGEDANILTHVAIVNSLIYEIPKEINTREALQDHLERYLLDTDDVVTFGKLLRSKV